MAQQKDPVMALNELCQKSSWPMPLFAVQQAGRMRMGGSKLEVRLAKWSVGTLILSLIHI